MTLPEIIKVVGFATGAALHLYFAWLISRRFFPRQPLGSLFAGGTERTDPTQAAGVIGSERTFVAIGLLLGFWFLGNLLITVQEILLEPGIATGLLRVWSSIAVIGIALFPSVLLHSHIAFWSWMDNYRTLSRRRAKLISALFYIPMIVLPYTVYRVNTGDFKPYLLKLHFVLVPYSIWFALALWSAGVLDWFMKDRLYQWAVRERAFLKALALLLFVNGAVEPLVIGVSGAGPNDYLWIAFILLSLLPTVTVAYYIYRYNLYELVIKGSIIYATLAVLFLTVYNYGIRHLDTFLVENHYVVQPGVVEGLLVLAMVALAGPLARAIDSAVRRLFVREIEMYRDVVRQVSAPRAYTDSQTDGRSSRSSLAPESPGGGRGTSELASLVSYTEETIRRGLGLKGVRIIPFYPESPNGAAERIVAKIRRTHSVMVEGDEDVTALGGSAVYALNREGRLLGLMVIAADPNTLVSDKRAVLEVLSGQVAIGIESAILIEDKLRLERELARRERLAALGQMAATVAHEVKNPLSSIKSIAQVMLEDRELTTYARDLDLIIGEINRLSSTVTQLLAFSRSGSPPISSAAPVDLQEMIGSVVAVLAADAASGSVHLTLEAAPRCLLSGRQAEALREVLINLMLNAIQASPDDGRVSIGVEIDGPDGRFPGSPGLQSSETGLLLTLSITDEGPGLSSGDQSKIFEPFYTTKPRGTGLGLAIVQRRVAELKARLDIVSPINGGRGTTFVIRMAVSSPEP